MEIIMGEVIVITSGKGGVGKTTTTANIGTGLAKLEKRVLVLDTDNGLRNLDIVMGLEHKVEHDIMGVLEERCELKEAVIKDQTLPNLNLLPAGSELKDSDQEALKKLISGIAGEYDYVLIDCPAGIDTGFKLAIAAADRAVIVTTPEVPAVRDAMKVSELLEKAGITKRELIVNRLRPALVKSREMMNATDVGEIVGLPVLGQIPDDDGVVIAANRGRTVTGGDTPAGKAFDNISRRILGEEIPLMELKVKKKGFFARLFGR